MNKVEVNLVNGEKITVDMSFDELSDLINNCKSQARIFMFKDVAIPIYNILYIRSIKG